MGNFSPMWLLLIVPAAIYIIVKARELFQYQGASAGGGKKLNKKLGLVSLIIMLLGILGLTNLVNPLL